MTIKEYAKEKDISLRDAYRLADEGIITIEKRLMEVHSVRKMWVMVVVDK